MLSIKPKGYKVAYHNESNTGVMLEMIPEGESLDRWTEMLTVQVSRSVKPHVESILHRSAHRAEFQGYDTFFGHGDDKIAQGANPPSKMNSFAHHFLPSMFVVERT
jgi:hypothetical protein